MTIINTIKKLTEMKADAKTDYIRNNIQMKIDILEKKQRQRDDNN